MSDFSEKLRLQTKRLAVKTIKLTRQFPKNEESWVIRKQLIRAISSVAANYRSACRGRSNKEFYSKLCIVVEELDESIFWIELCDELEILTKNDFITLNKEMNELLRILNSSKYTMKDKLEY